MATNSHSSHKAGSVPDKVQRQDGQVSATAAMIPMVHSAPVHGYRTPGWHCPDCRSVGVDDLHLCDARAARLEKLHGRPITAQEHASWQRSR
jgi:hypothetical protein